MFLAELIAGAEAQRVGWPFLLMCCINGTWSIKSVGGQHIEDPCASYDWVSLEDFVHGSDSVWVRLFKQQ